MNVRDRFLDPQSLTPPREINPGVSTRTDRAILWGMQLHPADRPQTVQAFLRTLIDEDAPFNHTGRRTRPQKLLQPLETTLLSIAGGLALLSLVLTLIRSF